MGKLRHIAVQVPDLEKAATFYEGVFGLKRVNRWKAFGNAISLSDGVVNLTLLHFPKAPRAARVGRLGRSASHRVHRRGREGDRGKDQKHGGEFFMQLPTIPASMRKRNSRTSTASCSTWPSTIGASPKRTDAYRRCSRADDSTGRGRAKLEHQLRRDDGQCGRGAYGREEERQPLVGLAFDSIGRYGHGALLRERFIPRLLAAGPDSYADGCGGIDPHRAWGVLMKDEKPGGHGERSGAVGLLDAALWDLAAKSVDEPLWRLLARHHGLCRPAQPLRFMQAAAITARPTISEVCATISAVRWTGPSPFQDQDRRRRCQ